MNENLISTLEHSLRLTRDAERRLSERLEEVESEARKLRTEIKSLRDSAEQTEAAISSLAAAFRPAAERNL